MPIYVDADRPARNSFSLRVFTDNYDSASGQAVLHDLYDTRRPPVVIESVGCTAEVAAGQGPAQG